MARRKKSPPAVVPPSPEFKNQPFRGLKAILPTPQPSKPIVPPPPPPPPPALHEDAATLFMKAVEGARPLDPQTRQRVEVPPPALEPRRSPDPDAEALAELCDLVSGNRAFDITDADEYVEGAVVGVDRQLMRRLREGEFSYQAHVDLHGLTRDEARSEVEAFVQRAYVEGKRCVLIIHGRGLNSKDQVPVLKLAVTSWLTRGTLGRLVMAFTSARACDGGVGALYVLLRRKPRKSPFVVLSGAKS